MLKAWYTCLARSLTAWLLRSGSLTSRLIALKSTTGIGHEGLGAMLNSSRLVQGDPIDAKRKKDYNKLDLSCRPKYFTANVSLK